MKKFYLILYIFLFSLFFSCLYIYADDSSIESEISSNDIQNSILEVSTQADKIPSINARHAVVLDRYSKCVLYGKKENEACKMASTTKIMTALVVIEHSNLQDSVKISKKAAQTGGSRLGLSTNDEITVENLLYGLMLKSGNDAAIALAEHVSGNVENFAVLMNKKARFLNLQSTNFVTPHGLDNENHFSSAYDLAVLADYALKNATFSNIVKTKTYTILINGIPRVLSNTNELLGNFQGIYGVKTGFTNGANRCLVTSCRQSDLDVICVVLGCDTKKNRTTDSIKLLNYTFNNYCLVNVKDVILSDFEDWRSSHKYYFSIYKGVFQDFEIYLNSDDFKFTHMAVKKVDLNTIKTEILCSAQFEAPLNCNSLIGNISLKVNNTHTLSIGILSANNVSRKSISDYLLYFFKKYVYFFKC